jgi:hypothetical protein
MNELFSRVIEKFENDVISSLEADDFEYEGYNEYDNGDKVVMYLNKNFSIDDLEDEQRDHIMSYYFDDFEREEFEIWWRDNGDEYEENFKKQNPNTEEGDIIMCAFDEWLSDSEEYNERWTMFESDFNLKLNYEIVIAPNTFYDRFGFELKTYFTCDYLNENLFKPDYKYVEVEEFQLNSMASMVGRKFDWETTDHTKIEDYKRASVNKMIAKKIMASLKK